MDNISAKFSPDIPLQPGDANLLGTERHFKALYRFIKSCATPMTIGLQGDWGSGKTSGLNQIKRDLDSSVGRGVAYPNVYVNTWKYAQFRGEEFLGPALIKGLLEEIQNTCGIKPDKMDGAKRAIGRVLKGLSAGISVGGISFDANKALQKDPTFEEQQGYTDFAAIMASFRSDFHTIVQTAIELARGPGRQFPDRLVVFIDDLDRVPPLRALELLEAVKNFLDVPDCVFVLAVDYEVVQAGMRQKLGADVQLKSGKSFFDKIIQLPFNMPQDVYRIGHYAVALLEDAGAISVPKSSREEWTADIEELFSLTVGRNPRSIKRVANYAALMELVRTESAGDSDSESRRIKITQPDRRRLIALICMQIAWPELSSYFFKHASRDLLEKLEDFEFIQSIPNYPHLEARCDDPIQLRANIAGFADLLFRWINEDGDDEISDEEFARFHRVMRDAELTRVENSKPPIVDFLEGVVARNCKKSGSSSCESIRTALLSSPRWTRASDVSFKLSGSRYLSILTNKGRQLGSIVSLGNQPLVLRLTMPLADFRSQLRHHAPTLSIAEVDIDRTAVEPTTSTGFGDTMIAADSLVALAPARELQVEYLRCCLDIVLSKRESIRSADARHATPPDHMWLPQRD